MCCVLRMSVVSDSVLFFTPHHTTHTQKAKSGSPDSVLDTIDTHCWQSPAHWMMNLGDVKGKIVDAALQALVSRTAGRLTALELGTYTGYAAVRMARLLRPTDKLYTVEVDPVNAKIAQQIVSALPPSSKGVCVRRVEVV
jgi:predicted O-methyltransferase YrrM